MITWVLSLITFFLGVLLFCSILGWVYVPEFFGIYGYKRQTPIGKKYIRYITVFPFLGGSALYLAWQASSGDGIRYIVLLPCVYAIMLWVFRRDKDKRCFGSMSENLDFQLSVFDSRWSAIERSLNGNKAFVFNVYCMAPSRLIADGILEQNKAGSHHADCYLSGGQFVNKSWFVRIFALPTKDIDKDIALSLLKTYLGSVWEAGGELAGWEITSQEAIETQIDLSKNS